MRNLNQLNNKIDCIKKKLVNYNPNILKSKNGLAAILIPVVYNQEGFSLVFTKRSNDLPTHSGEISFPGGMRETFDSSLKTTALRETFEEIGIKQDNIEIIGRLDDEISLHNSRVSPFVGLITEQTDNINFAISKEEVEKLLIIPLIHLYENGNSWSERWIRNGHLVDMYFYKYKSHIIWGLTAKIVHRFINIVSDCFRSLIC